MKTSSEYRALAWKEFRSHVGGSFAILFKYFLLGLLLVGIVYAACFATKQIPLIVLGSLIGICLAGVINYHFIVDFLSLKRNQFTKDRFWKVLLCALFLLIPNVFALLNNLLWGIVKPETAGGALLVIFLIFVTIGLLWFVIWWQYAVNATLPYMVHDNKETSVWESLLKNIRLMNGYKFALFCVELKICVWPLVILFVLMISALLLVWGIKDLSSGGYAAFLIVLIVFEILFFSLIVPVVQFARVHFYEDLRAEQQAQEETEA